MPKKPKRKPAKKRPPKPDANQIAFRVLNDATRGGESKAAIIASAKTGMPK